MNKLILRPSPPLQGEIHVSGSKNAALPILAASILADGPVELQNVPALTDVSAMCEILECLGCRVDLNGDGNCRIDAQNITNYIAPYDLASKMRGSFLIMGPMLAKYGKIRISLPGGCPIGSRPVDLHLKGFAALGAEINQGYGYIEVSAARLRSTKVYLDFPSVGATENILMAATLAEGITTLENAAVEPEIVDLANFLCSMGAIIYGAGTDTIKIHGVSLLSGTMHSIISDRIEAGSFMVAAAITRGNVRICNIIPDHLKPITAKLRETGAEIAAEDSCITVRAGGNFNPIDVKTLPFPGFPTDMQAQMMALLSVTEGTSIITETIFENRFMHAAELNRMGANIKVEGRTAVIEGTTELTGSQVKATDLRAGASLVLAGLVAKGCTEISDIYHIERGYDALDIKLQSLGANIEKISL